MFDRCVAVEIKAKLRESAPLLRWGRAETTRTLPRRTTKGAKESERSRQSIRVEG